MVRFGQLDPRFSFFRAEHLPSVLLKDFSHEFAVHGIIVNNEDSLYRHGALKSIVRKGNTK
jgi:hypothetical protein